MSDGKAKIKSEPGDEPRGRILPPTLEATGESDGAPGRGNSSRGVVATVKRVLRRTLLRDFRWAYAESRARRLVGGRQHGEPAYDLVFLTHADWRGWILTAICREIERHSGLRCHYYEVQYDKEASPELLPSARAYFVSEYSLYPNLLKELPRLWSAKVLVWYSHPYYIGVSEEEVMYTLRHATKVVSTCSLFEDMLIARGLEPERVACVLGGADPAIFKPHERGGGVVGFCTAHYERKAPDRILEIVRRMPHRRFILLGRHWNKYHRFAELMALPNFEYIEASYAEYPEYYAKMDVFVSASTLEGGPIPLIESMMANVVPVASRTGFAPDIIRHGENGYLFDVDSPVEEICPLIERAFDIDTNVRDSVERYSWANFTQELLALLPAGTFAHRPSPQHATSVGRPAARE